MSNLHIFALAISRPFQGQSSRSSCPGLNIWLKFGGLALPSWSLASFLNVTPDHHLSSCQVVSQYWGHEFEPSLFRVWLLCFEIICSSYWSWCSQWWNSILILIKDCEAQYWAHNNFETIPINGGEVVNTVPRMFFQHFTFETNESKLMHFNALFSLDLKTATFQHCTCLITLQLHRTAFLFLDLWLQSMPMRQTKV